MSDYEDAMQDAGEDRDEQELAVELLVGKAEYTDIERDLEMIREIALDLAKLPESELSDGDRGCLAYRVSAALEARKALGDILDVFMQACGDLMEADVEHVDTVGIISRGHPSPQTKWNRDRYLTDARRIIRSQLAINQETGEVAPALAATADRAMGMLLHALGAVTPTVTGCDLLELKPVDYRTITKSERWVIQVTAA